MREERKTIQVSLSVKDLEEIDRARKLERRDRSSYLVFYALQHARSVKK